MILNCKGKIGISIDEFWNPYRESEFQLMSSEACLPIINQQYYITEFIDYFWHDGMVALLSSQTVYVWKYSHTIFHSLIVILHNVPTISGVTTSFGIAELIEIFALGKISVCS